MSVLAAIDYYEPWWVQVVKARDHLRRRPAAGAGGAADRAQAAGPLPGPLRAQPGGPVRRAPAAGRHPQADHQGAVAAHHLDRLPVRVRADGLHPHRGRRAGHHPLRRRGRHLRHAGRPVRDRRGHRPAVRVRVRGDRLLRPDAGRLGLGLQVLVPGRHARRRPADLLRGGAGPVAGGRGVHRRHAVAGGDRRGPAGHVVRRPAVRRLPDLHGQRLRRDQPRAVRPARGRVRAGAGLQHRVRRRALRLLLLRRVPEHHRDLGDRHHDVPGRLAAALRPRRAGLDRPAGGDRQDVHLRGPLHLGAGHAAAAALRPADELRLEGAAPAGHGERAGHGDPGGGDTS